MSLRNFGEYLLRLTDVERQQLNFVIAALRVSEYTDEVDDIGFRRSFSESRMGASMSNFFDTVVGLAVASDSVPKKTRENIIKNPSFSSYSSLLAELFEVVRRHKQLNPQANRCEFGKLMMILQDSQQSSMRFLLSTRTSLVIPLKTVGDALRSIDTESEEFLKDPELERFIAQTGTTKELCMKNLLDKYDKNKNPTEREVLERCLRSIDDVENLILSNVDSLISLQTLLSKEFGISDHSSCSSSAGNEEGGETHADYFSSIAQHHKRKKPYYKSSNVLNTISPSRQLQIHRAKDGAVLSHTHEEQFHYVMESLVLWEIVQRKIFLLWSAAEKDMLFDGGGRYHFSNTGQGYQRVCESPSSYKVMSQCVEEATARMNGKWIGIKVIHLGDRDVPNPLVFIDKYTQIPGLVHPVVQTLKQLKVLYGVQTSSHTKAEYSLSNFPKESTSSSDSPSPVISYPGVSNLLRSKCGSYEQLHLLILGDFFRHGFDGSGSDGGSCIDGRLTSAWNWCQNLSKKKFYHAFLMAGFSGFD